jgi:hypothetical protein
MACRIAMNFEIDSLPFDGLGKKIQRGMDNTPCLAEILTLA